MACRDVFTTLLGQDLVGEVFKDKLGMEFVVVSVEYGDTVIRYTESGNEYNVKDQHLRTMYNVFDKKRDDFESVRKSHWSRIASEKYFADRDRRLEMAKQWQKENPEKAQHRNRHRRAKRKNAEGSHTKDEIDSLFVNQDGKCACCNVSLNPENGKHLDHIMPIVLGGSNYVQNLQWLCQFCNNSKGGRHPDEWKFYSSTEEFKERRKRLLTPSP